MEFRARKEKDRLTVALDGRLDEEGATTLRDKLLATDLKPFREVVLDIARVGFIGSAGIAKLLLIHNHLAGQALVLRLVNTPDHIRNLFESMKLDKLFDMT
jgi:anti-anti-sigma factor